MDRQQKGYLVSKASADQFGHTAKLLRRCVQNAVATGSAPSTFTLITACLTTTLFRIISPLLLAGGWSTAVVCINRYTTAELVVAPTLLTVLGTILGLVSKSLLIELPERVLTPTLLRGARWDPSLGRYLLIGLLLHTTGTGKVVDYGQP